MSFLDKFIKREKKKEAPEEKKNVKEGKVATVAENSVVKPDAAAKSAAEGKTVSMRGIIRAPHLTEKTSGLSALNKFVFFVSDKSNKVMVKSAVEEKYGVRVMGVNVSRMPGKERRRGKQIGWKAGFKKAVVTLKEGETIEVQ